LTAPQAGKHRYNYGQQHGFIGPGLAVEPPAEDARGADSSASSSSGSAGGGGGGAGSAGGSSIAASAPAEAFRLPGDASAGGGGGGGAQAEMMREARRRAQLPGEAQLLCLSMVCKSCSTSYDSVIPRSDATSDACWMGLAWLLACGLLARRACSVAAG
jgi:hypothetical protein